MADFKLGRLKFVWKGAWTTTTAYVKDDIVEYNGQGWVCETPHTSAGFPADRDSGKWTKMSEGFSWLGAWSGATTYQKNAVVNYLSSAWISVSDNNTNNPPLVLPATIDPNWELYAAGYDLSYVDQDIIPSVDATYDLGTPSLRFKDGYFSGTSIYLGPAKLEANQTSVTITNGDGSVVVFDQNGVAGGNLAFTGNTLRTLDSNSDLELDAAGTGKIVALTNMDVQGDLDVTGDITLQGNIYIGDSAIDTVTVQADFTSNVIPNASLTYDLGSTGQRWNNLYINKINDLLFDRVEGKTYYVTEDGDDLEPGTSIQGAFATVKKALTVAVAGDTVKVTAGTFTEVFPLTVPAGVSIVGTGIRATKIVPTVGTNNKDAFLLEGETGIVDLTVADFFYDSINDTGYAFRFKSGAVITTRSPYIERVTVLCKGSSPTLSDPYGFLTGDAGRGAEVDGAKVTRASLEAAMLFNECTFIVPNSRGLIMKNGARVEWLTCFTYFADLAIEGAVGATGRGGDGKTYITLSGVSGTWNVGNTLSYYADDGVTVLASGTIEAISGSNYQLDGSVAGFITNTNRANKPITVNGDAKLSNLQQKFGSTSLTLDGTGDFLSIASDADFGFGTGDFAIEGFVYRTTSGAYQTLIDLRTAATDVAPVIGIDNLNRLYYYVNGSIVIQGTTTIPLNSWAHFAVSRSGSSTKLWLNGAQEGSTYTDNNNYAARPVKIGIDYTGAAFAFTGYIDEVRFSKGVARYTAGFTPTASAFSGDSSTVLLLHFDGANLSVNIVDDGITIQDVRSSGGGTATGITRYDRKEFAAELRSISSANIYGNQGAKADGADVKLQLMAHNFAYIGTGADLTNNDTAVVQANEVIEVNNGRIYYNSVDQNGNFRVGEYFSVNFETGAVTFATGNFDVSSLVGINFTDGVNTTIIDPTQVTTGNLTLAGNTLSSSTGDITIDPSGANDIILNADVNIAGNLDVGGNITLAGNIQIGDTQVDTVTVAADFTSNIIPDASNTYDLGTSGKSWRTLYTGAIISTGTGSFTIPVGNTSQRPTPVTGMIRYNTDLSSFEGYAASSWGTLGGVKSVDGYTYILPETSPGASNDELEFYTGNLAGNGSVKSAGLTRTALTIPLSTASTTTTDGALVVTGGVGIGGTVNIGTNLNVTGTTGLTGNVILTGDLEVRGGDITTNQTTFNLLNTTATTLNVGGAATAVNIGAAGSAGTLTVKNDNVVLDGDLQIKGGDLTTNQTTFNLLNATATTVNFAGAGTAVNIGAVTGTTTVKNNLQVDGDAAVNGGDITTTQSVFNLINTNATTLNIGQVATSVIAGATTGTFQIRNATTQLDGDLAVNGPTSADITTTTTTATVFNTNATTLNIGGAATAVNLGNSTGATLTVNPGTVVGANTTQNVFNTVATTVNFAGAGTTVNIGAATGTTTVKNNLQVDGSFTVTGSTTQSGNLTVTGNLTVNGTTTTVNSNSVTVDDKNLELGSVATVTGITGTISSTATTTTITGLSTVTGLIPGQTVTRTAGTGNFGTGATIASIDSSTQITVTASTNNTAGSITFTAGGATDVTANGGGITVKGTTDKTFQYDNANTAWTSSENLNLTSGKTLKIAGTEKLSATTLFGADTTGTIGAATSTITVADQLVVTNDLTTDGDIISNQSTINLYPGNVTTLNIGASATSTTIGTAGNGTVFTANNLDVNGATMRVGQSGGIGKINPIPGVQTFGPLLMGAPSTTVYGVGLTVEADIEYGTGAIRAMRILTPGQFWIAGQTTTISGTQINGTNPTNNITVTIVSANPIVGDPTAGGTGGEVTALSYSGVGVVTNVPTTYELLNNTATTVNFAGQATNLVMGAVDTLGNPSGDTKIRNNLIVNGDAQVNGLFTGAQGYLTTNALTMNVFNTTATTINAFGAADDIFMGKNGGIVTISGEVRANDVVGNFKGSFFGDNSTVILNGITGDIIANDLQVDGQATFAFDLQLQGGDLTTNQTTFNLINDTALTLNIGQAATSIVTGALTGTYQIRNAITQVDGDLAVNGGDITTNQSVFNFVTSGASELNMGSAAQTVGIGSTLGTTTINNALTVGQSVTIQGTSLSTTSNTFSLIPDTATTINAFAAATIINLGEATGTTTIKSAITNVDGDLAVKGGDLTTDKTTFNLINDTATTVNFAGASTSLVVGSGSGTTNIRNDVLLDQDLQVEGGNITSTQLTFNLLDTNTTTINLGGDATQVNIGSNNGSTNILHSANIYGVLTLGAADSTTARIDSADNTFYLVNTGVDNLYMGGAASVVEIGSTAGTTTVRNALTVSLGLTLEGDLEVKGGDITTNQTTFNIVDSVAETINFGGAATAIDIGASSGTTSVKNNLQVIGDVEVQGGDITTNQSTFNLVNANATTVNFAGGAAAVNIGAAAGTTTIGDALVVTGTTTVGGSILPDTSVAYDLGSPTYRFRDLYLSGGTIDLAGGTISFDGTSFNFQGGTNVGQSVDTESTSFDLLNNIAQTINFGGDATTINMGSPFGGNTNIKHNLNVFSTLTVGAADSGSSRIDAADQTAYLFDTTVQTLYLGGTATGIQIGSSVGTTTINHSAVIDGSLDVNQDLTVSGNLTLTSLNTSGENNDFNISPAGSGRVIIEPAGGLVLNPGTTGDIDNTNIGATVRGSGAFTTLAANGQVEFTGGISSTDTTTGTVVVTGGLAVSENVNIQGNITAAGLTLNGTVLFENELAVPSGGTGAGQFNARGVVYGNSTDPLQSTAGSDYQNPYTGTNQQTSYAVLTTNASGVPVWTDVIDCGTF